MKRFAAIAAVVLLVLATAAGTYLATSHWMLGQFAREIDADPVKYKMERVAALLDEYFIDEYDPDAVAAAAADGAAAAMIEATGDQWSYYISADEMKAYEEQMSNSYVGIGVTILEVDEGVEIMEVMDGSPAREAGILPGDICIAVEGKSIAGIGTDGTVTLVQGEEGTFVEMTFLRGGEQFDLTVERRTVVVPVAELQMLEDSIALITVANFDGHCAEQTIGCIEQALEQGAEALLFDVRFNPGGFQDEMTEVLDYLLPEGEIFRSVDYLGDEVIVTSDSSCLEMPMAVLINEESYSAAEFFAAALQEYDWAEIVGRPTTGKGNFQYTLELGDGSAAALSCGKYFTPQGKSLSDTGVTPDVEADLEYDPYMQLYYGLLDPAGDAQLQAAVAVLLEQLG